MEKPRLYIEDPNFSMPRQLLDEETYLRAMESLVVVCADTLFFNKERKTLLLAKRISKPLPGPWMIGGRIFAGEKEIEGAIRCVERETGLKLESKRFQFLAMHRYICKERLQLPQEKGSDTLAYTYSVELSPEEEKEAAANLDDMEYEASAGLEEFNKERLMQERVHESILHLYDQLFPS